MAGGGFGWGCSNDRMGRTVEAAVVVSLMVCCRPALLCTFPPLLLPVPTSCLFCTLALGWMQQEAQGS